MKSEAVSLTAKQQRFVEEYLVDFNGARAAVAAGYGRSGAKVAAHRLTNSNPVRAAIAARQGVDAQRLQIDRHGVIQALLEAFALAREQRNPAAMVAATREVARALGLYPGTEHKVRVAVGPDARDEAARFEAMTDAELMAVVAGQG